MYNKIYAAYIKAGVALKQNHPVYQDIEGKPVDKDKQYGKLISLEIMHPEYILFADKTGTNASSKEDGNEGGTKFVCKLGQTQKTTCMASNNHCTVLLFTSATKNAVLCSVMSM